MIIKYLDKIYTFLLINKVSSFSKASKLLGISQPAVTQQIRILEEFLGVTLFERKKNGVLLTKEGKEFLKISKKFEKFLEEFEREFENFRNFDSPFYMGASQTIGNYLLPECMKYFKSLIKKEINLIIKNNDALLEDVENGAIDVAFVTKKRDNKLNYVEWLDDELVVFSNKPLPSTIELKDLKNYDMICREPNSSTRDFIKEVFLGYNFDCDRLNVVGLVHNSTALKFTILNSNEQLVSIISKRVIENELRDGKLFIAKIKGVNLKRKIYMVYKDKRKEILALNKFISS